MLGSFILAHLHSFCQNPYHSFIVVIPEYMLIWIDDIYTRDSTASLMLHTWASYTPPQPVIKFLQLLDDRIRRLFTHLVAFHNPFYLGRWFSELFRRRPRNIPFTQFCCETTSGFISSSVLEFGRCIQSSSEDAFNRVYSIHGCHYQGRCDGKSSLYNFDVSKG